MRPELSELRRTSAGFVWAGRDYPAARVSLRSASADSVLVVGAGDGAVLGVVERERAYSTVHDGAVYLHLGQSYLVERLDLDAGIALVEPFSGDWYTQAKKDTETAIEESLRVESRCGVELLVRACFRVRARRRVPEAGGERPSDARDRAARSPAVLVRDRGRLVRPAGIEARGHRPHAAARVGAPRSRARADRVLPLWAMCDRWDIGGLSTNLHFQTGAPTVFVYDGYPGGVGITERGFAASRAGSPTQHGCSRAVLAKQVARPASSRRSAGT